MIIRYLAHIGHSVSCCILLLCLHSSYSLAADATTTKNLRPIGIQATTHLGDHQSFRKDDVVSFLLSLDSDAYVTAIYVDANNNLYQIIPNALQQDNFYKASLFIPVPPQDAAYNFRIKPPYGEETLWVFASDSEKSRLKGKPLKNGMIQLTQSLDEVRHALRSNAIQRYDEASVRITTSAE